MKYLVIITVFLAGGFLSGFFTGYMFTRTAVNVPLNPTVVLNQAGQNPQYINLPGQSNSTLEASSTSAISFEVMDNAVGIFEKLKLAHMLADQSNIEQLQGYVLRVAGSRDPLYNYNLVSVFIEKYTSLDPLSAIAFIENHSELSNRRFISHIVTSWIREDPEAALDYYNSLTNMMFKNELAGRFMSDPTLAGTGVLAELEQTIGDSASTMRDIMLTNQLPPAQALEEALSMNSPRRMSAVQMALVRWLRDNPDEAIARIQAHPNTEERYQMMQSILHEYVNIDEDAAFAFARDNLTGNVRLEQQMLSMLGQRDPKRTLPMVEDFIARTGNSNPLNGIISTWIQQSPAEALAYIETMDEQRRATLYQSAAYSYVNSHPSEAFDWLLRQADRYPQMVETTIGSSINHNTIDIAERMIARVSSPAIRARLITGIGNYKASQNSEQALQWLDGFRRDPAYNTAVQNVIAGISHQNPKSAAEAIETRITEDYAEPLVGQIASNWYRANPNEAMSWLDGLPDGSAKLNALSNIVSSIAHQDPDQAMEVLESIPPGPRRTDAKRNIAFARLSRAPDQIDDIIKDLDLSPSEAKQMRDFAARRNEARSAFGGYGP